MKRIAKAIAGLLLVIAIFGVVAAVGYVGYIRVSVSMALHEAERIANSLPSAPRAHRGDPKPLQDLRPHPWSSPLNNRKFDQAFADSSAAFEAGDYDRAIARNSDALQVHPSDDLVWLLLKRRGDAYLAKGDADNALADYEQAARLGGFDPQMQMNHAFALQRKGKTQDAMKDVDAVIAANSTEAQPYLNRARLFANDGDLARALQDYEKALELDPRNLEARIRCAEISLRRNQNQKAILHASVGLKIDRRLTSAYLTRAKAYAQLWMKIDARADLERALRENPNDANTLNAIAWCRATCRSSALRDGGKAVAEAQKACELSQWKNAGYIDTLAAAHAEVGSFEEAIEYEKQALEMSGARENVDGEKERLRLYENRRPYREELRI